MDEKTKLFLFDWKEIALIFVFMIFIAITSFAIGIKIGKNISYTKSGYVPSDREKIEMKSIQEEKLEEIVNKPTEEKDKDKKLNTYQKLESEFNRLDEKNNEAMDNSEVDVIDQAKAPANPVAPETSAPAQEVQKSEQIPSGSQYAGKFTIQLASYDAMSDAEKFADGFRVRGYNPIINEVYLEGKGTWYRVSLGIFDTKVEARQYITENESLFKGQDFVISEIR